MALSEFELRSKVMKVDESHGLVLGFAIITSQDGQEYFDCQGDAITDEAMLEAATDFAKSMAGDDMHRGPDGEVVFMFPLTSEIAKAFDIQCPRTGLMIGMRPSPEVLKKFRDGEYTGFSIGGERIDEDVVEW